VKEKFDTSETGMINPNSKPPDPTDPPTPGEQLNRPGDKKPGPGRGQDDRKNG
jgi:hypothetical protein